RPPRPRPQSPQPPGSSLAFGLPLGIDVTRFAVPPNASWSSAALDVPSRLRLEGLAPASHYLESIIYVFNSNSPRRIADFCPLGAPPPSQRFLDLLNELHRRDVKIDIFRIVPDFPDPRLEWQPPSPRR